MFGFVKSDKEKRPLGGEIHQEKLKKRKIYLSILGVIGFILLNIALYYLTKV